MINLKRHTLTGLRTIAAAVVLLASSTNVISAQSADGEQVVAPAKVTAKVDSTTMTLGQRTTLHVEVLKNTHRGYMLDIPDRLPANPDSILSINGIEVRRIEIDSVDLGNGRVQLNYEVLLQPFDEGAQSIPPLRYVIDRDTFTSEMVPMKIEPPIIPDEMVDSLRINEFRPPLSIGSRWYDWIPESWPYWLGGALLLCLIIAAITLYIGYRRTGKIPFVAKKRIPPYVLATRRLAELKRKRMAENGNIRGYYTELTDILRQYLGGRFHIYALEMTSSQIIEAMEANNNTRPYVPAMTDMFRIADFVKFAKQPATTDDNIRAFKTVSEFVEQTKPVDEDVADKTKSRKGKQHRNKKNKSKRK